MFPDVTGSVWFISAVWSQGRQGLLQCAGSPQLLRDLSDRGRCSCTPRDYYLILILPTPSLMVIDEQRCAGVLFLTEHALFCRNPVL